MMFNRLLTKNVLVKTAENMKKEMELSDKGTIVTQPFSPFLKCSRFRESLLSLAFQKILHLEIMTKCLLTNHE